LPRGNSSTFLWTTDLGRDRSVVDRSVACQPDSHERRIVVAIHRRRLLVLFAKTRRSRRRCHWCSSPRLVVTTYAAIKELTCRSMSAPEPSVIPMLSYRDGVRALAWLVEAFGFVERRRMLAPDGRLSHGEIATPNGGMIMLASPSPHYEGPRLPRETCAVARAWSEVPWVIDGVLVYVPDVAAHRERAAAAGAVLLGDIETGGPGTRYRVEDIEGHRWMFMERAGA
jgi:uncharacterized glyoxalase superfamily protein PhnB